MDKKEERNIEIITKEIDSLNASELHDLFMFYYKINHNSPTIVIYDKFIDFLESFDSNPFKPNDSKVFKKQMAESLIACTADQLSLITAIMLIKKKFTVDEIINHYYANINVFENDLF